MKGKEKDIYKTKTIGKFLLAIIAAGIVGVIAIVLTYYFINPVYLDYLAANRLSKMMGTKVLVGDTEMGWNSVILKNIRISTHLKSSFSQKNYKDNVQSKNSKYRAKRLFYARKIVLTIHPWELISSHPAVNNIYIESPTVYLTENMDTGKFNYQQIHFPKQTEKNTKTLPTISLHNAKIHFGQIKDNHYQSITTVPVDGSLKPLAKLPNTYSFSLKQLVRFKKLYTTERSKKSKQSSNTKNSPQLSPDAVDHPLPTLTGMFNTHTDKVNVSLEHFRFAALQRFFMPQKWGQWWQRLNPSGGLPTLNLSLKPDKSGNIKIISGKVFIHDVSLTLPFSPDLQPRMTNVSGLFTIAEDKVRATNLKGRIAGLKYTLNGETKGLDADAPFSVTAQTGKFTIPHSSWYIFALPANIQKKYKLLKPSGTFKVKVNISRHKKNGPIDYSGQIKLINARIKFKPLPYPIHKLKGSVNFNKSKVEIEHLTGLGPSGAKININNGTITSLRHNPTIDMTVEAKDIPIDKYLLNSLKPKYRKSIARFTSKPGYLPKSNTNKIKKNILHRVNIHIYSDSKNPKHILTTTIFDIAGFHGSLKHWRYPYTCISGKIIVAPKNTKVINLVAKGPTGARATFNGIIDTGAHHNKMIPHINITNIKLPLDKVLLKSLPSKQSNILNKLDVHGIMEGKGKLFKENGHKDFNISLHFKKGYANPVLAGNTIALKSLRGTIQTSKNSIELDNITSNYNNGKVTFNGNVNWKNDNTEYNIITKASNIELDNTLKQAFVKFSSHSKNINHIFSKYKPTGVLQGQLDYKKNNGKSSYTLKVLPEILTINMDNQKIKLTNITGDIVINRKNIKLNNLKWNWSLLNKNLAPNEKTDAKGKVDGNIRFNDGLFADIVFGGSNNKIGLLEKDILPNRINKVLNNLKWQGEYKIKKGHLIYNSTKSKHTFNNTPILRLNSTIELKNNKLNIGAPITKLNSKVDIHINKFFKNKPSNYTVYFKNGNARAWDRLISNLSFKLTDDSKSKMVKLNLLQGNVYGGKLIAKALINPAKSGQYTLRLTMQNANLDNILHPEKRLNKIKTATTSKENNNRYSNTYLSYSLTLTGKIGQKSSRLGNGTLHVHGAKLYKQPFALTLLNTTNLAIPESNAFDDLTADYFLQGNQVHIEPIKLESNSLAIIGAGNMRLPSLNLDINLVCRNSKGPTFGPISEMFNLFKDELISIKVTGTLNNPNIQNYSLEGIQNTWNQIFKSPDY